jgi:hypothetical protein
MNNEPMTKSVIPLHKMESFGTYEARLPDETHIIVPIAEWDTALIMRTRSLMVVQNCPEEVASNSAYFELIDAQNWRDEGHQCAGIDEQGHHWNHIQWQNRRKTATAHLDNDAQSESESMVEAQYQHKRQQEHARPGPHDKQDMPVFNVDTMQFKHTQEKQGVCEHFASSWHIEMDWQADGDEAALERMASYFYQRYQKAADGSPEEARHAGLYTQILHSLAEREHGQILTGMLGMLEGTQHAIEEGSHELAQGLHALTAELALFRAQMVVYEEAFKATNAKSAQEKEH